AAGTAELEELGVELLAAVRKATAAVEAKEAAEARAALAEAARQAAEAARNEADRMRRAAQAEAHAAIAAADAERSTRAEAEGLTETLKMEQERRARVFNNAVKAASQLREAQAGQYEARRREVAERSGNEAAAAAKRVLELEAELQQLRASSGVLSLFQLPTKQDVLAGLGLELWKDDRLRWKSEADMEAAPAVVRPVKARGAAAATGSAQAAAAKVLGVVPLRVWLIAGYLSLLHIAVMVSFTRTRDVSQLCVCDDKGLLALPTQPNTLQP
ncbi:predicted protein, partial [Haematococcus lacustris]